MFLQSTHDDFRIYGKSLKTDTVSASPGNNRAIRLVRPDSSFFNINAKIVSCWIPNNTGKVMKEYHIEILTI